MESQGPTRLVFFMIQSIVEARTGVYSANDVLGDHSTGPCPDGAALTLSLDWGPDSMSSVGVVATRQEPSIPWEDSGSTLHTKMGHTVLAAIMGWDKYATPGNRMREIMGAWGAWGHLGHSDDISWGPRDDQTGQRLHAKWFPAGMMAKCSSLRS